MIFLVKNPAVFCLDIQLAKFIAMRAHGAVFANQQVSQQVSQWVFMMFAEAGSGEVIVNPG